MCESVRAQNRIRGNGRFSSHLRRGYNSPRIDLKFRVKKHVAEFLPHVEFQSRDFKGRGHRGRQKF